MAGGERPRSFGIGGAGNIRTHDQAIIHDMISASEAVKRRKSSLGSLSSTSVKSGESRSSKFSRSFKSMFGSSRPKSIPEDTK